MIQHLDTVKRLERLMREQENVSRETVLQQLSIELIEEVKTDPLTNAVVTLLLRGDNPYSVIEWLINACRERDSTIAELKYLLMKLGSVIDKQY